MLLRRAAISQPLSPFFKLPAELRIAIYEYLDFPPIDPQQCRNLILSCRKAKEECEEVSVKKLKAWITVYKQDILPQCAFDVRILLPQLPPIGSSFRFNTIKEITLVLRGDLLCTPAWPSPRFFENLRHLNPVFGLWLEKLTLHFLGSPERKPKYLQKTFTRLQFIIEGGLTYAHDPSGQEAEKRVRKFSDMWDYWQPQPPFMKSLVISWDLTEDALSSDDFLGLEGRCKQHPTTACYGRRAYTVTDGSGLIGESMIESSCRFRPSEPEQHRVHPPPEHKAVCLRCTSVRDYRRHIRGLPVATDERWI